MSKRLKEAQKIFDNTQLYSIDEALEIVEKYKANAVKFDESVDVDVKLGVDTNKGDQNLKGFVELPNGNGKKAKVLVFADDDNIDKALKLGAVRAGGDELVAEIAAGKFSDFDKCVATTKMMPKLAKIAKILGPRGLMPNPKLGTVVNGDVSSVVSALLKGRSDLKTAKDGSVKLSVGKLSFTKDKLKANIVEVIAALKQMRPASVKANYFVALTVSTTMGVGVKIKMSEVYAI